VTTSSQVAGASSVFTFTFQPKNPVPVGGKIIITLPSQVNFAVSDPASLTTISIFGTQITGFTAGLNSKVITYSDVFNSTLNPIVGQSIIVTISNMQMPISTGIPSSSFVIQTTNSIR
jgi:hypothetical protein